MANQQTHYEVHANKAGSWTVQQVCNDRQEAIENAKNIYADLGLKAVKVLKVVFKEADPVYHDTEIFYEGDKGKPDRVGSIELIEPICMTPTDFHVPDARREMSKLLAKPLEGWQITPLELLYHQGHLQKLNDTGQLLQGAVQRVAISQVQKTGQKVTDRVLELYAITDELLRALKDISVEEEVPPVNEEDLQAMLLVCKEAEDWRKIFMMSMARFFQETKTLQEKFEIILAFLCKYDDPDILEMLDRYLADFLLSPEKLKTLMGGEKEANLGDALLSLIEFIKGERDDVLKMSPEGQRINYLLQQKYLPETRRSLIYRMNETLSGNRSFVNNDPEQSLQYPRRILADLCISEGEHIGGQKAVEALYARSERMSGSSAVGLLLEGLELPLERVDKLLSIGAGLVGPEAMRAIANYVISVLDSTYNKKIILESEMDALDLVAELKKLQNRTKQTGFQEFYRDRIMQLLDGIGVEALVAEGVVEKFIEEAGDEFQVGLGLLQIISREILTEPEASKLVREYARKTISSVEFMGLLQEKADKEDSQVALFKEIYVLLEKDEG